MAKLCQGFLKAQAFFPPDLPLVGGEVEEASGGVLTLAKVKEL